MKKSELKQLIRECYKEVIIENSNPFNATVEEDEGSNPVKESNPFNATVEEDEGSNPVNATVEEGITVTDSISDVIEAMEKDIERIGGLSTSYQYEEDLRKIPLIRSVLEKRFFRVQRVRGDDSEASKVDYKEYLERWNAAVANVKKRDTRNIPDSLKRGASDEDTKKANKLLNVLKKKNNEYMTTHDYIRLTSSNGEDSIVLKCDVSSLFKVLSLGILNSTIHSLVIKEAKGKFEGVALNKNIAGDSYELTKLANAIADSVREQGGSVNDGMPFKKGLYKESLTTAGRSRRV